MRLDARVFALELVAFLEKAISTFENRRSTAAEVAGQPKCTAGLPRRGGEGVGRAEVL